MRSKARHRDIPSLRASFLAAPFFLSMVIAVLLLGGGGRPAPLANLLVQLCALLLLGLAIKPAAEAWRDTPLMLKGLIAATFILPLLQIVPLPASVWGALPGRQLVSESLALAGLPDSWRSMSVAPGLTLLAVSGLIAPLAVFLLASAADKRSHKLALLIMIAAAILGLAIGAVQLASDGTAANFYASRNPEWLYGLFANHNATGLFFVLCLLATFEVAARYPVRSRQVAGAAVVATLLVIGTVLTQSRSSIALLVFPAAFLLLRLAISGRSNRFSARRVGLAIGVVAIAAVSLIAVTADNDRLREAVERFDDLDSPRFDRWQDAQVTAERFWPVGAGTGTFDEVFQLDESLELLYPTRAGRAHNDYLELVIESGLPGILLLFMWIGYFLFAVWRMPHNSSISGIFLLAVLGCLMAQSLIDYPLRNQIILCVAALCLGILNAQRSGVAEGSKRVSIE